MEPHVTNLTNYVTSPRTKRYAFNAGLGCFLLFLILTTSILAYGAFYFTYVPDTSYTAPIYFDYASPAPFTGQTSGDPAGPGAMMPRAHVDLPGRSGHYLSYDHAYTVIVELQLPASTHNRDLGNFMVGVELRTEDDRILHKSARPGILRYESTMVRSAKSLLWAAPYVIGLADEEQTLRIPIMEGVHDSYDEPVHHAIVTLSSDRVWTYGASLHLIARLTGLRYLMYYWSIPTALVFISAFAFWCLLCTALAWHVGSTWWQARAYRESEEALAFEGTGAGSSGSGLEDHDDLDDDDDDEIGNRSHLARLVEEEGREGATSGESYGIVEEEEDAEVPETILAELGSPEERLRRRNPSSSPLTQE